jgi:hypothetical protein
MTYNLREKIRQENLKGRSKIRRRKQTGIKVLQFPVPTEEFPVSAKTIPCSVQNRESSATNCNCSANKRQNPVESVETAENFKIPCYFPCFQGKGAAALSLRKRSFINAGYPVPICYNENLRRAPA